MKRVLALILAISLISCALGAEEIQIAFRFLDDYVQQRQEKLNRSMTTGATLSMVFGGILLGGAAGVYFGGDAMSMNMAGTPMDPDLKNSLTLGMGSGGLALIASGAIMLTSPARDLRSEYSNVFREEDPVIQEAMAAATLKTMADKARAARIGSISLQLTGIGLLTAFKIGANLYEGQPWGKDLASTMQGQVWALAGVVPSFFNKNEEELLYDKYLAARQAIYSSTRPKSGEAKGTKLKIEVQDGEGTSTLELGPAEGGR
jgi:hypothetical protein